MLAGFGKIKTCCFGLRAGSQANNRFQDKSDHCRGNCGENQCDKDFCTLGQKELSQDIVLQITVYPFRGEKARSQRTGQNPEPSASKTITPDYISKPRLS